ncbi:hypothetical protein F0U60_10305 [Archangium minus]|uniref:Lipoprotein n=1 Tax=Archangium minus TaxID=83450 RepID=A0ABY9WL06_9BACT|nr:hypothetical protein F0U60_10305 [Archangium minus]
MKRSLTLFRSALFVLSLSACGLPWIQEDDCAAVLCGPCPPALSLRVSGAPGQPVPEVVLGAGQGSCFQDANVASCNLSQNGPGRYELDIQALGYRPVHLVEEVAAVERTGCCHCGYEARVVNVQLVPE